MASYNNHWGVPLTLARLPPDAAFCVVEIGMNHAGEIAPLARLARPHVAVITAIEKAHIGYLGSIEAIADEKASILRGLEPRRRRRAAGRHAAVPRAARRRRTPRGVAVRSRSAPTPRPTRAWSQSSRTPTAATSSADDRRHRGAASGSTRPGRHMAMNALAALAAAAALGDGCAPRGAAALAGFARVAGRGARRAIMCRVRPARRSMPWGGAAARRELQRQRRLDARRAGGAARCKPARRRIAVLGDMLELGDAGPAEHAGAGAATSRAAPTWCSPAAR